MSDAEGFYEELARAATRSDSAVLDVVAAVLKHQKPGENLRVRALGSHMATLTNIRGKALHILDVQSGNADISRAIDHLVTTNPRDGSEVIVCGGGAAEAEAIDQSVPRLLMHPFVVLHRTTTGEIRTWPATKVLRSPRMHALQDVKRLNRREIEEIQATIAKHAEYFRRQSRERSRYFRAADSRRVIATYVFLAMVLVMFVLQSLWMPQRGGDEVYSSYFLALGALEGALVFSGDWFRLVSVAFLHGNYIHLGMNAFALYLLGRQMEQALGTTRFIVLYVGSMVAASLASAAFSNLSVGASGAIWGLLGAQAALAYRLPPVLPESIAERMKPLVKMNLLINVVISFAPFIDTAAHFGGGIAGAVIIASKVLYRKSENQRAGAEEKTPRGTPKGVTVAAWIAGAFVAAGLGTALIQGQPWRYAGL